MTQEEKIEVLGYLTKFSQVFNDMIGEVTKRVLSSQVKAEINPFSHSDKIADVLSSGVKLDTKVFLKQQFDFLQKQQLLWQNASRVFMGEMLEPMVQEEKSDKRFSDGDWEGNPVFNYIKQAYLLNAEYVNQMVEALEFEDGKMGEQVRFYTRQLVNSMAPSNYVFTNPEVCREILKTEGECLARGIDNFMRDLENSPTEAFKITQVDINAFTLGETLAYTPGEVVFKNRLIELICYFPASNEVAATPLLIVPPFINKFYILDLDERKSLVKWLVDKGYEVFMISWVNPDETYANTEFSDYMSEGVLAALDEIIRITGAEHIQAAGYCVGGTLLGITQSYLTALGDTRINSCTFLTTLFDFSEPGEVGAYISGTLLPLLEQNVESKGYMDGRVLALSFSLLRENNLFWSFFIENYLKGKDPMPFDILYWNSDSTNLPAKAYLYYLKNMYIEDKLKQAGALNIGGQAIDLSAITTPNYCLAARADHIVLWQAAFKSAKLLGGPVRFVLTESGHVAGVINPAASGKYPHWVAPNLPKQADQWLTQAEEKPGSWWLDWEHWLRQHSLGLRCVEPVHAGGSLEAAPGAYVKRRLENL
ncbi:MAG: poly(R)-hydroxyalkanoic acid synthase, class [Pseudomonadota bacterium]